MHYGIFFQHIQAHHVVPHRGPLVAEEVIYYINIATSPPPMPPSHPPTFPPLFTLPQFCEQGRQRHIWPPTSLCRNMSGHALMGHPASRLEKMVLMISSYVLVYVVCKRRWLSLYGCYLLIYVIILPFSLEKPLTRNQTLFNIWLHVRTYPCRNITKLSYLVQ